MPAAITANEAVLNEIANEIHATAVEKGFWDHPHPFLAEINTKLMLIVSEVAEAPEVLRNHYEGALHPVSRMTTEQENDFLLEVADIIIRGFDTARYFTTAFGPIITGKMAKNSGRPHRHGKRF